MASTSLSGSSFLPWVLSLRFPQWWTYKLNVEISVPPQEILVMLSITTIEALRPMIKLKYCTNRIIYRTHYALCYFCDFFPLLLHSELHWFLFKLTQNALWASVNFVLIDVFPKKCYHCLPAPACEHSSDVFFKVQTSRKVKIHGCWRTTCLFFFRVVATDESDKRPLHLSPWK